MLIVLNQKYRHPFEQRLKAFLFISYALVFVYFNLPIFLLVIRYFYSMKHHSTFSLIENFYGKSLGLYMVGGTGLFVDFCALCILAMNKISALDHHSSKAERSSDES